MKPIRALAAVVLALAAISLLVAVALNLANIVGRYVFFSPIASAEEVMLFLFVGTVFLGNSYVGWKGRQIRMDVFLHALPAAWRRCRCPRRRRRHRGEHRHHRGRLAGDPDARRVRPAQPVAGSRWCAAGHESRSGSRSMRCSSRCGWSTTSAPAAPASSSGRRSRVRRLPPFTACTGARVTAALVFRAADRAAVHRPADLSHPADLLACRDHVRGRRAARDMQTNM
jgi:hypothetical protein